MLIKPHGTQFLKKPDQQTYDFTLTDFTRDYQYHDLDLSAKVPAGAKAVMLWGAYKSDTPDCEANFAQNVHTGEYLKDIFFQHVANIGTTLDSTIPLDGDRIIQYRFSNVTYQYINISVVGWWI